MFEIWYDINDPGGLGRREAPNIGKQNIFGPITSTRHFFRARCISCVIKLHHGHEDIGLEGVKCDKF